MNYLINLISDETPPHKHKHYEIIIYTKGDGVFHTSEKDIRVEPGKILIIPPGTIHSSSSDCKTFERMYIGGDFNRVFSLPSITVIDNADKNEGLFLAKTIYNNRHSAHEYLSALINAFTHYMLKNIKTENEVFKSIRNITEKITENFYDFNLDLNALLKNSGYSEDYIRAQFKNITGKTPTEFLTEIRIAHACYLIDTYKNTLSLADIAEKCGYSDYVYFSKRFKSITGVSPRKYMEEV